MFLIKKLSTYFTSMTDDNNIKELERINDELDEAIANDQSAVGSFYKRKQVESNEVSNAENELANAKCYKKIGVITQMKSNHGIIDNSLMFNLNKVAKNINDLKVGYKVEYLAYKADEEDSDFRITKITEIVEESWGTLNTEDEISQTVEELKNSAPMCFSKHKRSIYATIKDRREHFMRVECDTDAEMEIDLESISMDFVPQKGDHVYLHCVVQTDEQYVDYMGEILECNSVTYKIEKPFRGTVSRVEYDWGVIDNEAYFMFEILEAGYKPNRGDRVEAQIIKNDSMEAYSFRCLKVTLLEKGAVNTMARETNGVKESKLHENKNGIVVTDKIKFTFGKLNEILSKELVVTNTSEYTQEILRYKFNTPLAVSQIRLRNASELRSQFRLQPGASITFQVNAKAKKFGLTSEVIELCFSSFTIARSIEIEVGDITDADREQAFEQKNRWGGESYRTKFHNAKLKWDNVQKRKLVPGVAVVARPRFVKQRIALYDVPERLKTCVLSSESREDLVKNCEENFSSLRQELKPDNYYQRFSVLLHIEEIERFAQMRQYDRDRAHFERAGEYLSLHIENLAEKRPSLIIGDSIHATNPWAEEDNKTTYQGCIHKVFHNKIMLKFDSNFHAKYNGEDYRLEFFFSRSAFRKMHHSVQNLQSCLGNEFLFPTKVIMNKNPQWDVELNDKDEMVGQLGGTIAPWFNQKLNHYQKVAVKNAVRGEARPMPYVIFGPPGTGKTITVIETILQLFKNCPYSRMLVGAPTNSAADLIATRLIESKCLIPGDFVRLVGQNLVERDLVPDHLKPYCATVDIAQERSAKDEMIVTDSGLKLKCRSIHIGNHRIIISTCMTLGNLLYLGYPKTQFTHVIIDEAGQCIEPEIMTVIKQVDGKDGQIILAGDPLQLGPIVLQKYAAEKGLDTSFLVRLLATQPYSKDRIRYAHTGYNPLLINKLIYSYRAIPSVLEVYNTLFYDSELKPTLAEDCKEVQMLNTLKPVFAKNYPQRDDKQGVLFWGVRGQNRQDSDSPSWYNGEEASQLYLFALKLFKEDVKPKQIGIITPYQKQVKKIRQLFEASDLVEMPKIGTVEEFQGQERDIILISMVRSSKNLVQMDLKYTLGFLQSPKRMNVALSRARSLLVMFGNPHLLATDPIWKQLLTHCIERNAYSGCDLPTNLQNIN